MVKRRIAAATIRKCPPGVMCMTPGTIFFMLIIAAAIILVVIVIRDKREESSALQPSAPQPINIQIHDTGRGNGDDRYSMAPQPYRSVYAGPEYPPRGGLAAIPIGIPTRGLPEKFQSIGILTTPDGQALPLYGRRTASSSDKWNYYTRTDTYNPVPIPLKLGKRDCMDDIGCNEAMDGDEMVSLTGKNGTVNMYRMDGPKYIPGLV